MASPTTIERLPNEMLISILSAVPTRSLLPLVQVSRRFHALSMCVLHQRLRRAASLSEHQLIHKCYDPGEKNMTSYLYCDYLYTDGLENSDDEYSFPEHRMSELKGLYSHFRLRLQDRDRKARLRDFTGAQTQEQGPDVDHQSEGLVKDVCLDDGQTFAQLCTMTNLIKAGPNAGLFWSQVVVGEGVIRVKRDWLKFQASGGKSGSSERVSAEARDPILWVNTTTRDIGLRFRVVEQEFPAPVVQIRRPTRALSTNEPPVSYRLEFEELVVRSHLLLKMVEKSEAQEARAEGFYCEPPAGAKVVPCPVQAFFWVDPYHRGGHLSRLAPMVVGGI